MKFSLIMCTIGRTEEVTTAVNSIVKQSYQNYELIIVDQNVDNNLGTILKDYIYHNNIIYIRSNIKGLSRNRNLGLKMATGSIIAFPDDDCEYPINTLETIDNLFKKRANLDFITINIKDTKTDRYFIKEHDNRKFNKYNFKPYAISIGIFIKYKKLDDVTFDESLGAGTYFGAAEESDLISKLIDLNYAGKYYGSYYVLHPIDVQHLPYLKIINRYKSYNLGFGALMKKEIILRKKYMFLFLFILQLLGRFIGCVILIKKRKLLWISFIYQIKGYLEYKIK